MNTSRGYASQRGFIALDMLFGLLVLAAVMTGAAVLVANQMDSQNYQIAADQQKQVADAAAKYLKDNFATVYAAAGTTTPAQITPAMLRNTNYLPAGFTDANAFGQTFVVLARRVATNQLESIVLTTGGQVIDEMGTREIAENLGAPGGFVPVANTGIIQGVRGGWSLTLSNYGVSPGAGHTASALFLQDGTLANDYLYRNAVAGKPELNRMNTALNMGGNDINNAATINATGDVNLNGTVTAGGDVHAGSIYLNGNATLNGTVTAGGDVRAGSMYLQGNASMNGNATVGGSIAVTGDTTTGSMYARGNVQGVTASMSGETYTTGWFRTRGDTGWYSEKWGGGWHMTDSDWVRAYAGKSVYTSGQMRGNSLFSDGRTYVGEYIQLIGSATENAGCATNGLVSRTAQGSLLTCQDGLWKGATASIDQGTWCGLMESTIGLYATCKGYVPPACPSGYTGKSWQTIANNYYYTCFKD